MFIERLKLSNYRSFQNAEVIFGNFSAIAGANASGKSNLIAAFKFLRDASLYGFSDAISLQGGLELMQRINSNDPLALEYDFSPENLLIHNFSTNISTSRNINLRLKPTLLRYKIILDKKDGDYKIHQTASISYQFIERLGKSAKEAGAGLVTYTCNETGTLSARHTELPKKIVDVYKVTPKKIEEYFSPYFSFDQETRKRFFGNLKNSPIVDQSNYAISGVMLDSFSFFDFDPRQAKLSSKFAGKKELEEDGSNFNVAMNYVLADKDNKIKFLNTLTDFLPFVKNLEIEQSIDKSLLSIFAEDKGDAFPSHAMSDGSMYLACLVLGVSFSTKPIVVIEEPEKYIHPSLAIKIIEYLLSTSHSKQIVVTSHSPQIIKYSGLENIIIINRKMGESSVMRANEIPHVNEFMKNDMGLDQIFSDNLLTF